MSKKPNPNASYSQTLSAEEKKHYDHSLVFAADMGMTYLFSNPAATVAIINPAHNFGNFKEFLAKTEKDTALLEQFHRMAFDKEPSKEDRSDPIEWSVRVWIQLCKTAANRLTEVRADGRKTPAKLQNRRYELVKTDVPPEMKMPPQSKTCLEFLAELCKNDTAYQALDTESRGIWSISEEAFNKYVIDNAARLRTRQDPWRIFQYYRPELIKAGFIRLV